MEEFPEETEYLMDLWVSDPDSYSYKSDIGANGGGISGP
jgi:hypothetical protein